MSNGTAVDPLAAAITPLVASSPYGAIAVAILPLIEGLLSKLFGGLNLGGTSVAVPVTTQTSPDLVSVLQRIATALEAIEANTKK